MPKWLLTVGLLVIIAQLSAAEDFDHSAWDRVLKAHVNAKGEVDYAGLKKDRKDLNAYIAGLSAASPLNKPALFPTRDASLAYWINAYNAFVTWGVSARYPVASVQNLGPAMAFFGEKQIVAGGVVLSLNNVENDILRKEFHDPRIHFAIVCASLSCPNLAREAYTAAGVQGQLDRQAREFVNEPRNLSIDGKRQEITLSRILDWYSADFGGGASLMQTLLRYANEENRRALLALKSPKIKYCEYDWRINDVGSRK